LTPDPVFEPDAVAKRLIVAPLGIIGAAFERELFEVDDPDAEIIGLATIVNVIVFE
jgi:hypothetical protein